MRPPFNPIHGLTAATITIPDMLHLVLVGTDPAFRIQILTEHNGIAAIFEYSKSPDITGKGITYTSDFFGQFSSVL